MTNLALSVLVDRNSLGLAPLECNDGQVYKASPTFLGAMVSWNRNQTTSPYVDGAVTIDRTLEQVQEQVAFEVWGRSALTATLTAPQLQLNMDTLVQAFVQDSYTFTVTVDGAVYAYQAEAADFQLAWVGMRWMARQGQVTFTMPRNPVGLQALT